MSITIKFPSDNDVQFEQGKPVVIIGANGSGKTRLSVKIEELNDKRFNSSKIDDKTVLIHRISAQKSLTIADTILIDDYESSQRALFYGDVYQGATKIGHRYGSHPATFLLNDFDKALALLFSENNKELQDAHEEDKKAVVDGKTRPPIIETVVEKATKIWNDLLPQRKIDLTGNGVHAIYKNIDNNGNDIDNDLKNGSNENTINKDEGVITVKR